MRMKGYIVTNAHCMGENTAVQAKRLNAEFALRGMDVEIVQNKNLCHIGADGEIKCALKGDFIIFLDKDKHTSYMLERAGFRLFNSARSIELTDDKIMTHVVLSGHGVRMPETFSSPLCYTSDNYPEFLGEILQSVDFPVVVKEAHGSLGKQVMLAQNMDELATLRGELMFKPHLYQQAITTSMGRDVRLIVIGGKVVASMERNSTGDFRSNISLGGSGKAVTPPASFIEVAQKCARILGLDYCGVDLMYGEDGEPVLCEVNSNAFFTEITRITGVNVAELYVEHVIKKMRK